MTKTEATRRAADLAAQISAENETAYGLALALETLTVAGDETPAERYNAAARRAQADAVLLALADRLDRMQAVADQLEEITMQLAQPGRLSPADDQSGAALCAQEADTVTLKLSRNTCNRLSMACLSLAMDFEREAADDQTSADRQRSAQESAKMWYAYRDEVRAQIDDHDRRHAEPAQGGAVQ